MSAWEKRGGGGGVVGLGAGEKLRITQGELVGGGGVSVPHLEYYTGLRRENNLRQERLLISYCLGVPLCRDASRAWMTLMRKGGNHVYDGYSFL